MYLSYSVSSQANHCFSCRPFKQVLPPTAGQKHVWKTLLPHDLKCSHRLFGNIWREGIPKRRHPPSEISICEQGGLKRLSTAYGHVINNHDNESVYTKTWPADAQIVTRACYTVPIPTVPIELQGWDWEGAIIKYSRTDLRGETIPKYKHPWESNCRIAVRFWIPILPQAKQVLLPYKNLLTVQGRWF